MPQAPEAPRSTPQTPRGSRCSRNYWLWALPKIRSRRMQTLSSCTLSRRSTTRRLKLTTRQGEQEHLRRRHRAHHQQHALSVLKPPAVRGEDLPQHRRQLAERRPTCPIATLPRVLRRLLLQEYHPHLLVHQSPSSGRLPHSQMLANLQINLLRLRTEHEHNLVQLLGHLHLRYRQRHQ